MKNIKTMGVLVIVGALLLFSFSSPPMFALSPNERKELDSFLRVLFRRSEFGYTLFGQKPMSFFSYCSKTPDDFPIYSNLNDPLIERYYLIYEKYKQILKSENYIILDQASISNKFPTVDIVRDVIIVNKSAFIETVNANLQLFKEKLGQTTSAESLISDIIAEKNVLFDVLQEDELLWGILLGYGIHNAEIYARREAIEDGKILVHAIGYSSLEEELEAIDDTLVGFTQERLLDLIPLPMFLCDVHHRETDMLKNHYRSMQHKLSAIYNAPNFLELVMQQLKKQEAS